MFEKDLSLCILFDKYAALLSPKKKEVFDLYYNFDYSLSEISEHTGTSRQAVRELLLHTAEELRVFESSLRLSEKQIKLNDLISQARFHISSESKELDWLTDLLDTITKLYE